PRPSRSPRVSSAWPSRFSLTRAPGPERGEVSTAICRTKRFPRRRAFFRPPSFVFFSDHDGTHLAMKSHLPHPTSPSASSGTALALLGAALVLCGVGVFARAEDNPKPRPETVAVNTEE